MPTNHAWTSELPCLNFLEPAWGTGTRACSSEANSAAQARNAAYLRTMSVGLSRWRAVQLSMSLQLNTLLFWLTSCVLSCIELAKLPVL